MLLLGGGIGFGLRANGAWNEYRNTRSAQRWDELNAQIRRDSKIANGLYLAAGVSALTAGVLYFLEGARAEQVRVGLAPTAGGFEGRVAWRF
jgi:hypothetical protein